MRYMIFILTLFMNVFVFSQNNNKTTENKDTCLVYRNIINHNTAVIDIKKYELITIYLDLDGNIYDYNPSLENDSILHERIKYQEKLNLMGNDPFKLLNVYYKNKNK